MLPSFASLASIELLNQRKKPSKKLTTGKSKLKPGILAFRTITTMLALIRSPTETSKTDPVYISKEKRKELRVLDALAAILIREHEKVAVMAVPHDRKSIQVMSVVNLNNLGSAATAPSWPIRWFASLNSRRSAPFFPENDEESMRVVDPDIKVLEPLSEHKNNPDKLLDAFLLTQW
jgi:hypothetical protein